MRHPFDQFQNITRTLRNLRAAQFILQNSWSYDAISKARDYHNKLSGLEMTAARMTRLDLLKLSRLAYPIPKGSFPIHDVSRLMQSTLMLKNIESIANLGIRDHKLRDISSILPTWERALQFNALHRQTHALLNAIKSSVGSNFARLVATVGFTGRFDTGLVHAATVAAEAVAEGNDFEAEAVESSATIAVAIAMVNDLVEVGSRHQDEDVVPKLHTIVSQLCERLDTFIAHQTKEKRLSTSELVVLVVTIVGLLLTSYQTNLSHMTYHESGEDMGRLRSAIEESGKAQAQELSEIRRKIDNLAAKARESANNTYEIRYVIERTTHLMSGHSTRSRRLKTLYPNQIVMPLRQVGKWVEVDTYDYFADQFVRGWVLKKYLWRGKPSRPQTVLNP